MTTVERMESISRAHHDKWTKKEQLCLASAVTCNGNAMNQDWIAVSRTLVAVCGNQQRPTDWYSQKNCALQYEHLLEDVESTKRTIRSNEGCDESANTSDLLLRQLTEERIAEIQKDILEEQEEYVKLIDEIKSIQSNQATQSELQKMWKDIECSEETQRIDEMKMENRMREREQRKQEISSGWNTTTVATDTTTVDMDLDEIIGNTNPTVLQQLPGTSPLLSSLLKSPNAISGSSVAATAPTITTLLTSGTISNSNQPAITLKSNISASESAFITRPISGPPVSEILVTSTTPSKIVLSPSQSAPTLSMLLEKNKSQTVSNINQTSNFQLASQAKPAADTNNDDIAMDIDESIPSNLSAANTVSTAATSTSTVSTLTNTVSTVTKTVLTNIAATTAESDETDPIEEQQLLEVFQNIGNMDDIDIDMTDVINDEEVDFLKGDDDATTSLRKEKVTDLISDQENAKNDDVVTSENVDITKPDSNLAAIDISTEEKISNEEKKLNEIKKPEFASSDDSNDNIPLAEVASLENKERSESYNESLMSPVIESNQDPESSKPESAINTNHMESPENEPPTVSSLVDVNVETDFKEKGANGESSVVDSSNTMPNQNDGDELHDEKLSNKPNIKPIQLLDDKLNCEQYDMNTKNQNKQVENTEATIIEQNELISGNDDTAETITYAEDNSKVADTKIVNPSSTRIADTDEDSSLPDTSKDTPTSYKMQSLQQQQTEKSDIQFGETKVEVEQISDSNFSVALTTSAIPVRPPLLRKLRDRDRSESPMIDDETTTTSDHSNKLTSRRRYSSTPVLDSIPNSPASSETIDDRRETRGASKKLFLNIYNNLFSSKHSTIFQRPFQDEHLAKYVDLCLRPMDLPTVKKNIETGVIRNITELYRDVMIMCQNALIIYKPQSSNYKATIEFIQECQLVKEFPTYLGGNSEPGGAKLDKEISRLANSSIKARGSSRKSQRLI